MRKIMITLLLRIFRGEKVLPPLSAASARLKTPLLSGGRPRNTPKKKH